MVLLLIGTSRPRRGRLLGARSAERSTAADVETCRKDCFCNYQFNVKACSVQGIFRTADVLKNDPDSLACPASTVDVMSKLSLPFFVLEN